MSVIPAAWMPEARMTRIHVHWTAGAYTANATDMKHYHVLVEGDGKLVRGTPSIALNEAPVKPGYAAHTRNANSGAIGVSMCCMRGAVERPFNPGPSPMTKVQWDMMVRAVADLATRYNIAVTDKTVLTHAEVQPNLGIAQSGKWDVAILAFDRSFDTPKKVGDRMRREVVAAQQPEPEPIPPEPEPDDDLVIVNITTPRRCPVEVIVNGEVLVAAKNGV